MQFSLPKSNGRNWPTSTTELDPSEQFIVWSFRRWVLGLKQNTGDHWNMVWNEFARQLGSDDGRDALSGFALIIKALQCYARRRITYHQPCCPYLGADEVSLVCFIAACQNGETRLSRSLAEWLVKAEGAGEMMEAGHRLADAMRQHGLLFPPRIKTPAAAQRAPETPQPLAMLH